MFPPPPILSKCNGYSRVRLNTKCTTYEQKHDFRCYNNSQTRQPAPALRLFSALSQVVLFFISFYLVVLLK